MKKKIGILLLLLLLSINQTSGFFSGNLRYAASKEITNTSLDYIDFKVDLSNKYKIIRKGQDNLIHCVEQSLTSTSNIAPCSYINNIPTTNIPNITKIQLDYDILTLEGTAIKRYNTVATSYSAFSYNDFYTIDASVFGIHSTGSTNLNTYNAYFGPIPKDSYMMPGAGYKSTQSGSLKGYTTYEYPYTHYLDNLGLHNYIITTGSDNLSITKATLITNLAPYFKASDIDNVEFVPYGAKYLFHGYSTLLNKYIGIYLASNGYVYPGGDVLPTLNILYNSNNGKIIKIVRTNSQTSDNILVIRDSGIWELYDGLTNGNIIKSNVNESPIYKALPPAPVAPTLAIIPTAYTGINGSGVLSPNSTNFNNATTTTIEGIPWYYKVPGFNKIFTFKDFILGYFINIFNFINPFIDTNPILTGYYLKPSGFDNLQNFTFTMTPFEVKTNTSILKSKIKLIDNTTHRGYLISLFFALFYITIKMLLVVGILGLIFYIWVIVNKIGNIIIGEGNQGSTSKNIWMGVFHIVTLGSYLTLIFGIFDIPYIMGMLTTAMLWVNFFFLTILSLIGDIPTYINLVNSLLGILTLVLAPIILLRLFKTYGKLN